MKAGIIDSGKSNRSGITFSMGRSSAPAENTGTGKASGSDPKVMPLQSFAVDLDTSGINPATGKYTPVGQKATLEGKPVIWDGTTWQPDPEGGSEDSPTKSSTTPAQDGHGLRDSPLSIFTVRHRFTV